ncbi:MULTISPECIES: S9 family peptidase [Niastella]|uniref:S9 family peptidase n=1 Tax=Niastella soli TaxID=2821487 RepID=A0ABS3Z370_9BACT|nr:prolyl oligopeptidase family serine peptidase [Niastella soli]MBO9204618.1 S9 family peptidase [Niastella soli]
MKFLLVFIFTTSSLSIAAQQKRAIDSTVFDRWPALNSPIISANGRFIAVRMESGEGRNNTIIIQSTDNNWKKEIAGGINAQFTDDSRWVICNLNTDSLCLIELGKEQMQYYPHIQKYEVGGSGSKQWISMQQNVNGDGNLLLRDLTKGTTTIISGVIDFAISKNGKSLVIERADQLDRNTVIEWVNTEGLNSWGVYKKSGQVQFSNFTFDSEGKQVIFLKSEKNKDGQSEKSVWYYQVGMAQAVEKLNAQTPGIPKGVEISNATFSRDGSRLFFDMNEVVSTSLNRSGVMVDVWSYMDDKLQAQQLNEVDAHISYKGVINLSRVDATIIQGQNEYLYENRQDIDDYFLLTTNLCHFEENNWRAACRVPLYLVNANNGARRLIKDSMVFSDYNGFSPDGKYVLYYDPQQQAYFSYAIKGGKAINITQNVPFSICDFPHTRAGLPKPYSLFKAWLPGKGVVINDEYDLWLLDPAGINTPVCLTKGYGRANGINFQIFSPDKLITEQQIVLLAFRPSDKANGFYLLNLAKPSNPEPLTMGPYLYCWKNGGELPKKAAGSNSWIVQRQSESEFPNYFFTKDFKTFVRLSNLQPQSNYNWLTTELHEWTTPGGKKLQGILYKPENFDSSRKYPVIFHFYEEKSDELHKYLLPGATEHNINIPHFVSNGYLMFVPDIKYTIGEPIESIYNSVALAALYLAKFPWVDSAKMGLQGHSLGGYEVNALISRTNIFAAAASAAGASDLVSNTGSINRETGYSLAYLAEILSYRIGGTIWEKKNEYIRNSPVFNADRINTPLLMFNCKGDGVVPFAQGVELFLALRRLGKPVWMLQYDMSGHQLGGKDAEDYTIRLMQFFDHYLKGKSAPRWMVRGIPATLKGVETGYELETTESTSINLNK